jgi:cobyrinic acid a,c-diamide synthase
VTRGLVIASPHSGSGKTTLTLGLLRALKRAGHRVVSAKSGPDYIDPAFHAAATGAPCINLDTWAMRPELLEALVRQLARAGELTLCEGAMGLFDGVGGTETGSTAALAARFRWPVVLVVDAGRQGASVAALLEGFVRHRADVHVAGVIFNRVGSDRHGASLTQATRAALPELAVLGLLRRDDALALPSRHLGLVQAREHGELEAFLERAATTVADACDLENLVSLARSEALPDTNAMVAPLPPLGQRISVARDVAFGFAYGSVLGGWRAAGAELSLFSPLADEAPADHADAVYLPGGYPELHAERLAANQRFLDGLRASAGRGAAVYGECGGFMVLGHGLIDAKGERHAMAGLLPVITSFAKPALQLGYREMRLAAATPLGPAGATFRGHEFHYARTIESDGAPLFQAFDGEGASLGAVGAIKGTVMGSFMHLIDRTELMARNG